MDLRVTTVTRPEILSKLEAGEVLLLDGANGTELKRRGITDSRSQEGTLTKGITPRSALASLDAPIELRGVHEDYLTVGADIVTTNTFNTNRGMLIGRGIGRFVDKMEDLTRRAAEITLEARDKVKPMAYVSGSMSPPRKGGFVTECEIRREFKDKAEILVTAGIDILQLEYIRTIADARIAIEAVSCFKLPVFLGIANVTVSGKMEFGETFQELADTLKDLPVTAALTMCSNPRAISSTLPRLRDALEVPVGAYPNIVNEETSFVPKHLAECGREWLVAGAQIIGGCCGTTPGHIAALRKVVDHHVHTGSWPKEQ